MATILNFPSKEKQSWTAIERIIRERMQQENLSQKASSRVVENVKTFFKNLDVDINFSFSVEWPASLSGDDILFVTQSLETAISEIQGKRSAEILKKLVFERIIHEINICIEFGI